MVAETKRPAGSLLDLAPDPRLNGLHVRSFQERAWDLDRSFLNLPAFNGDLILDDTKLNVTPRLRAGIQGEVRAYYTVCQFQRVAASVVAETG